MMVSVYTLRVDPEVPIVVDEVLEGPSFVPRHPEPTWEEFREMATVLGPDTTAYMVDGRPLPPPGEPVPPRRQPARVERPTGIRDEDLYPAGAWS